MELYTRANDDAACHHVFQSRPCPEVPTVPAFADGAKCSACGHAASGVMAAALGTGSS